MAWVQKSKRARGAKHASAKAKKAHKARLKARKARLCGLASFVYDDIRVPGQKFEPKIRRADD
jgi:hypothetical protein